MNRSVVKNLSLGIVASLLTIPGAFVAVFVGEILIWIQKVWFGVDGLIVTYAPPIIGGVICGVFISGILKKWMVDDYIKTYVVVANVIPVIALIATIFLPIISNESFHVVGALQAISLIIGLSYAAYSEATT